MLKVKLLLVSVLCAVIRVARSWIWKLAGQERGEYKNNNHMSEKKCNWIDYFCPDCNCKDIRRAYCLFCGKQLKKIYLKRQV